MQGSYELIYTVTDEYGNTSTVTRTVQVVKTEEENPGENPGGDPGQNPGENPDQTPGGSGDGTQGTIPGGDNGVDADNQNGGFQNMSFDNNGKTNVSGLNGSTPHTADLAAEDLGLSLIGLLASIAVIAGFIKKKAAGLFRKRK